jgi:hypothetical protein
VRRPTSTALTSLVALPAEAVARAARCRSRHAPAHRRRHIGSTHVDPTSTRVRASVGVATAAAGHRPSTVEGRSLLSEIPLKFSADAGGSGECVMRAALWHIYLPPVLQELA